MIRPVNDYRIGNLVLDEDGELCKIEQLSSEKFECFQQVSNIENKSCISTKYPSNIYAIELTEEWLKKAGFAYVGIHYCKVFGQNDLKIKLGVEVYGYLNLKYFNHIHYVHQLQNLYFALTGVELVFSTEP